MEALVVTRPASQDVIRLRHKASSQDPHKAKHEPHKTSSQDPVIRLCNKTRTKTLRNKTSLGTTKDFLDKI